MGDSNILVIINVFCVVFGAAVPATFRQTANGPLVTTGVGTIRGLNSANGDYSMFLNVPYATLNESNHFGLAIPHPGFNSTFDAIDDSLICPQRLERSTVIAGSLNCLNINIYVPNTGNLQELPVMVWIHGGGYIWGSNERRVYGPDFLVKHDVILVTVNYRLGVYGYMCLNIPEVPGNQGYRDVILALRWIKNNIQSFGGDINRITLFGESAGSMVVDYLYLYGPSDLFTSVIMQSGSSLAPGSGIKTPNQQDAFILAQDFGLETSDIYEALEFLSSIDAHVLVQRGIDLNVLRANLPCVEDEIDGIESLISVHPLNAPVTKNIPVLTGCNSHELLHLYIDENLEFLGSVNIQTIISSVIRADEEYLQRLTDNVRRFYYTTEDLTSVVFEQNIRWDLSNLNSDIRFGHPLHRSVIKYSTNMTEPVYMYVFSYVGERNLWKNRLNSTEGGAVHYDEIAYLFQRDIYENSSITPEDHLTIDRMTTMWTNFAKYGSPTPQVTELLPVLWSPATPLSLNYLDINQNLTLNRSPWHDRMAYLDLFFELNSDYLVGALTQASSVSLLNPLLGIGLILLNILF